MNKLLAVASCEIGGNMPKSSIAFLPKIRMKKINNSKLTCWLNSKKLILSNT